ERRLLFRAALLLARDPRRPVHAGHRRGPHRRVEREHHRAARGQPPDPSARRLRGPEAPPVRGAAEPMTVSGQSLTRKLIESHLVVGKAVAGEEVGLATDQSLLTDTNGNISLLQFEAMGLPRIAASRAVAYIDHHVYQFDSRHPADH